jgi:UDP-glucose 4,6-dehydratase
MCVSTTRLAGILTGRNFDIDSNGKDGEIYNIGTAEETSVLEISEHTRAFFSGFGSVPKPVNVCDRAYNDRRYYINCDKLEGLGWKPTIPLSNGLDSTLEWYRNNQTYWSADVLNSIIEC